MTERMLASRIVAVYSAVGFVWIVLSDWISFAGVDIASARLLQTFKGLSFVVATAALLYWLIRRGARLLGDCEARFRLLVERSPDAVLVQTKGRVTYANDAMLHLLGIADASSLLGRAFIDVIEPGSRAMVRKRMSQMAELDVPVVMDEETFLRADGTPVLCEVSAIPARACGEEGAVVFVRDITQRVRQTEQRVTAQRLEAIRRLAGGLAHDFNNLLQVINGYTELASEALDDGTEGKGYLEHVRQSGQRASALVGQLLKFSHGDVQDIGALAPGGVGVGTMSVLQQVAGDAPAQVEDPVARTEVACDRGPSARAAPAAGAVVLIAEDDARVRALSARILERAGFAVVEAADGVEALDHFKTYGDRVEAVILDIVMPRMGGFVAHDQIRALNPSVPIIFASGFSGFATPAHVTLTPGVNLLQKPFQAAVLIETVSRLVGRRTHSRLV